MGTKVTLLTAGTDGDVQPFVALGLGLRARGYDVTLAAPANFERLVVDRGLAFSPLRADYYELATSDEGKAMLSGNPLRVARTAKRVVPAMLRRLLDDSWVAAQGAEGIVYHPKVLAGAHIAEALGRPALLAHAVPMLSTTRAFPPPGLVNRDLGGSLNRASYGLLRLLTLPFHRELNAWRGERLDLPPRRFGASEFTLGGRPIPRLYCYSPHVVPIPSDWDRTSAATGYWFLDSGSEWRPSEALSAFLEAGDPPVYVGFGSTAGLGGQDLIARVTDALRRAGLRGVIATGWGGEFSGAGRDDVLVVDAVPHDWLFPRTAAVVHHGGAGTTGVGLRAGRPTVVCPFAADQPFWGRVVQARGVGPRPIPGRTLATEDLAAAISFAASDEGMRDRAEALGKRIAAEAGVSRAVDLIAERLVS